MKQRLCRQSILWIVASGLVFLSLIAIVIMKNQTVKLKASFKSDSVCPQNVTKFEAWSDHQLPETQRAGLLNCFCKPQMGLSLLKMSFEEFQINNKPDTRKYCGEWFNNYLNLNAMVIGTSLVVVIINIVICLFFDKITFIEKKHSVNDETMSQFKKITVMQFINIAVVILLVNFESLDKPLFGFVPILQGEYRDFSSFWYGQVGKTLCTTLLINIFSPHATKLLLPLIKLIKRFVDRGGKRHMIDDSDPNNPKINTKKFLQSELNLLYTGD